jgi:hypothetical protein
MMIMPSNNQSGIVHYFAGKYPGKVGLLWTPQSLGPKGTPPFYMPYALDNGCFTQWDETAFFLMLMKARLLKQDPLWVCVPDVVADARATTKLWQKYHAKVPFKKAFVVQDGHTPEDVPHEAYAVFVGGSTEWKMGNADRFKGVADWLHIGRVNTEARIRWAESIGADSIDGTGFFRGSKSQKQAFIEYFEGRKQMEMFA